MYLIVACIFLSVALIDAQTAIANIVSQSGSGVTGVITFTKSSLGVSVNVSLSGLDTRTSVAIHVHSYGDLSSLMGANDGLSAGGHYAGAGLTAPHGCPGVNATRHEGDMGSWTVTSGAINVIGDFDLMTLNGIFSILGRAVVVHNLTDSCTGATGNAGNRLGFGVIGLLDDSTIPAATQTDPTIASAIAILDSGVVYFAQQGCCTVTVLANITLDAGSVHGLHIHTYGNLVKDAFAGSGGHYNPMGVIHGFPNEVIHHYGDLGNIMYYSGQQAWYSYKVANAFNLLAIIGRSIVVHSGNDHGSGIGCDPATGSSGTKMKMGVIGVMNPSTVVPPPPVDVVFVNDWSSTDCVLTPSPSPGSSGLVVPSLFLALIVLVLRVQLW